MVRCWNPLAKHSTWLLVDIPASLLEFLVLVGFSEGIWWGINMDFPAILMWPWRVPRNWSVNIWGCLQIPETPMICIDLSSYSQVSFSTSKDCHQFGYLVPRPTCCAPWHRMCWVFDGFFMWPKWGIFGDFDSKIEIPKTWLEHLGTWICDSWLPFFKNLQWKRVRIQ